MQDSFFVTEIMLNLGIISASSITSPLTEYGHCELSLGCYRVEMWLQWKLPVCTIWMFYIP